MAQEYEINEKDIDWMIGKIKLIDPKYATPEMAITVLENMYAKDHLREHDAPEVNDAIIDDIEKAKKTKTEGHLKT